MYTHMYRYTNIQVFAHTFCLMCASLPCFNQGTVFYADVHLQIFSLFANISTIKRSLRITSLMFEYEILCVCFWTLWLYLLHASCQLFSRIFGFTSECQQAEMLQAAYTLTTACRRRLESLLNRSCWTDHTVRLTYIPTNLTLCLLERRTKWLGGNVGYLRFLQSAPGYLTPTMNHHRHQETNCVMTRNFGHFLCLTALQVWNDDSGGQASWTLVVRYHWNRTMQNQEYQL